MSPLISRSTMFDFAFPKGLFAYRPPVCGITIAVRLMYRARPGSCTATSARSYFSKSFSSYTYFFFGFFGSFFAFAGGSAATPDSVPPGAGSASSGGGGGSSAAGGGGGRGGVSSGGGGGVSFSIESPDGLLLPALHELLQGDVVHLDDLVLDPGDVPVRPAHPTADPLHEDLVVLVDEVDRAVPDRERGDLPPILHELDLHALPERGVRLLRLDRDLLQHDPLRLGRALERIRFLLEVEDPPLVVPVRPPELLAIVDQLSCGVQSTGQGSTSG